MSATRLLWLRYGQKFCERMFSFLFNEGSSLCNRSKSVSVSNSNSCSRGKRLCKRVFLDNEAGVYFAFVCSRLVWRIVRPHLHSSSVCGMSEAKKRESQLSSR